MTNSNNLDRELDNALKSFDAIQSELNYKQATVALRELVDNLDLNPLERAGLEPEIEGLTTMLDKLERSAVQIAAFGMVGRGKSSVLNALVGKDVFETGPLHGVTRTHQSATWLAEPSEDLFQKTDDASDVLRVVLPGADNTQVELIDTPGIDEVDGMQREALARQVATQVDLILFIIAGDITQVEYQALSQLRQAGKPLILVFNKIDQYPEASRMAIYQKIRDERVKQLLSPAEIVMVAAQPKVAQAVRRPDGSTGIQRRTGTPQVQELKLKILEILHREGKSLIALNSMLVAGDINEQLVERKMAIRDESADRLIWQAVITKAVAIALNPITVVDIFTGAVIDVATILSLSRLYGIPMTQQGAVRLLHKIALSMGGITFSELLATFGLSGLKSLLGFSVPATGGASLVPYLTVAITQASFVGFFSYTIGQVTKSYLANGASWGSHGPKAVVSRIIDTLDESSILNRIKDELSAKLHGRGG